MDMQARSRISPFDLHAYAEVSSTPLSPFLEDLRSRYASELPNPALRELISGPIEGRFIAALVRACNARSVLELGTFVGYGAIAMAEALAPEGRVTTCEINAEHAEIARRNFAASGYADLIDLHVGPALELIDSLPGPFDLVYLDADKVNYLVYYEALLPKLAPRGLLVADNTLWLGDVYVHERATDSARAVADFNRFLSSDGRVNCVLLPYGDGVTLCWLAS